MPLKGRSKKELGEAVAQKLGIRVLSCDYAIMLELHERSAATSGELLLGCPGSPATFQAHLKGLAQRGLVEWNVDEADGRRRVYRLSDQARELFNQGLRFPTQWDPSMRHSLHKLKLGTCMVRLERSLQIRALSFEYMIVLALYEYGPMTTGDLIGRSFASPGALHLSLRRLLDRGLVHVIDDPSDRRRKVNCLADWACDFLDEIHVELREWAASLPIAG
ncbi:MAG: MarR family transcriptional regulator [Novosphingobium sp.]|nr:MarR family transcriptional regulator [Novosphingobium sp.]